MDNTQFLGKIKSLVEKYNNFEEKERNKLNEEETKGYFIRPLFEALGWNFENSEEVSFEKNITGKRADFEMKLIGIPKFYLEAKAIKVDLDLEQHARQAINYAWNKGVTWAVLTDFENIKVFNAQAVSKSLIDKLVFEISYNEYLTDDRLQLLSKQAFVNNELDKYAEKHAKKIKKQTVNEKLFNDFKIAREILTKGFAFWNEKVDKDTLDEGVQRILDRLVFIRVLEDRQLEPPILKQIVREWQADKKSKQLFPLLISKFRELDEIYDSSLFKEHACEKWEEYNDPSPIQKVIMMLYGSDNYEYDFKEIPSDILGGVYEQYLGYIAKAPIEIDTKGKSGKLLDAENVKENKAKSRKKRKEQGIYYTPKFIVDYIIKNALGEKLKEIKTINDLQNLKVLDPACGSGSFLVATLNAINEKYKEFGAPGDQNTKAQILQQNIYGVDLDPQAVELAKLNLLIATLDKKAKLPDITKNIRVGNSLISGTEEDLKKYFGDNWREKRPFNWEEEFADVFKRGGFDVVIGNPPYIKEDTNKQAFDGLHHSPYYQGKMDIWTMFGCVGIDLLKTDGFLGFIAPSNWVSNFGASIFREKILNDGEIKEYIDFGDYKVFQNASIQTMILIYQKRKCRSAYLADYLRVNDAEVSEGGLVSVLGSTDMRSQIEIKPSELRGKIISFNESGKGAILAKMKSIQNYYINKKDIGNGIDVLQDFVTERHLAVLDGTSKKGDGVFVLSAKEIEGIKPDSKEKKYLRPYYTTNQINRYLSLSNSNQKIIYADSYFRKHIEQFPNLRRHLDRYHKILTSAFAPYGLHRAREERFFEGEGLFVVRKTKRPAFTYVNFPCYVTRAFLVLKSKNINLKYLLGILNSNVIYFWFKNKGKLQGDQLQVDKEPLLDVPIYLASDPDQNKIITLVDKILSLNKEFRGIAENSDQWQKIKDEIAKTDKKIDEEVYKLYGLTEEEIKVVEREK